MLLRPWMTAVALVLLSAPALAVRVPTAILVDKKTNSLRVAEYVDGEYRVLKSYHATLGKVAGDKEDDSDLKTPEGIYQIGAKLLPPQIKAKLGAMALSLNYPNSYDQIAGRTGSGIMLHGTNEPDRLKQDYDSEGCVVVRNEEIREIEQRVRVGLTPVLIFSEIQENKPQYLKPGQNPAIRQFFETWVKAWETEDLEGYIAHYHSDFSANGMDRAGWKNYKASLNRRYATIQVGPESVIYYFHPKYWVITFTQNYRSTLRGGGVGHKSRGSKVLYVAEENGQPRIIAENYTTLMW